jgi:hypothetical protein
VGELKQAIPAGIDWIRSSLRYQNRNAVAVSKMHLRQWQIVDAADVHLARVMERAGVARVMRWEPLLPDLDSVPRPASLR